MADSHRSISVQMPSMQMPPITPVLKQLWARVRGTTRLLDVGRPVSVASTHPQSRHESKLLAMQKSTSEEKARAKQIREEADAKRQLLEARADVAKASDDLHRIGKRDRKSGFISRTWKV